MTDFCKETYKKTLEEVVYHIRNRPEKSIHSLLQTLEYSINAISRQDDEHRGLEIKDGLVKSFK